MDADGTAFGDAFSEGGAGCGGPTLEPPHKAAAERGPGVDAGGHGGPTVSAACRGVIVEVLSIRWLISYRQLVLLVFYVTYELARL